MKVLFLTNMYPKNSDLKGIFVREQYDSIKKLNGNLKISVLNIGNSAGILKYFFSVTKILRLIINQKPDIIHVHYGLTLIPLFFVTLIIRLLGNSYKVIVTFHGSDLMASALNKHICNIVSCFVVDRIYIVSEGLSESLYIRNRMKSTVIPCGVNFEYFKRNEKKQKYDKRSARQIRLVFPSDPGRPEKDFCFFEKVVASLETKGYSVSYSVLKNVTREQVKMILYDADLLLLTSKREGSPQIVKEALCCGLPVISRKVGDVATYLSNIPNCAVRDSVDDFVDWIDSCFVFSRIDKSDVSAFLDYYDSNNIAKLILDDYSSLLGAD